MSTNDDNSFNSMQMVSTLNSRFQSILFFRSSVPNLPNYALAMNSGFHITQSINLNCVWQNGPQQRFLITYTHY